MIKKFSDKELDEIRISGEEIYDGVLLHVKKDKVKLPDGKESAREYIRHPGAVAVVPVLDDGRIVLVKQCRYPLNTVMWEIPAGKLDHGAEDLEDCAKRELSEETGYEAKVPILFIHGSEDNFVHTEMVYKLYEACRAEKQLLVVEGAGHGNSYNHAPELYFDTVFGFLEPYIE